MTNGNMTAERRVNSGDTTAGRVKRIGVVFGTFAPLHVGHQQEIYKAAAENGEAIVIVSGYDGDRGDKIGLGLQRRYRYLREAFKDEPDIHIACINENNIPKYVDENVNGWPDWARLFVDAVRKTIHVSMGEDVEYKVYTGDAEYLPWFGKLLPELRLPNETWNVVKLDRSRIPVSATMIREDPMKHWSLINRVFRRFFTKKVLVIGAASGGKSTLVRRLARSINAPFSEEYARTYEVERSLTDDDLTVSDYVSFFEGQDRANCDEAKSPSNQGIVIFDTDAIVTKTYASRYLPEDTRPDWEPVADLYIRREDPDLILVIPPTTNYVDDGFRNMDWADDRWKFHEELMDNVKKAGLMDRVVILDAEGNSDDVDGFYARYSQAKKAIESHLGVKMDFLD